MPTPKRTCSIHRGGYCCLASPQFQQYLDVYSPGSPFLTPPTSRALASTSASHSAASSTSVLVEPPGLGSMTGTNGTGSAEGSVSMLGETTAAEDTSASGTMTTTTTTESSTSAQKSPMARLTPYSPPLSPTPPAISKRNSNPPPPSNADGSSGTLTPTPGKLPTNHSSPSLTPTSILSYTPTSIASRSLHDLPSSSGTITKSSFTAATAAHRRRTLDFADENAARRDNKALNPPYKPESLPKSFRPGGGERVRGAKFVQAGMFMRERELREKREASAMRWSKLMEAAKTEDSARAGSVGATKSVSRSEEGDGDDKTASVKIPASVNGVKPLPTMSSTTPIKSSPLRPVSAPTPIVSSPLPSALKAASLRPTSIPIPPPPTIIPPPPPTITPPTPPILSTSPTPPTTLSFTSSSSSAIPAAVVAPTPSPPTAVTVAPAPLLQPTRIPTPPQPATAHTPPTPAQKPTPQLPPATNNVHLSRRTYITQNTSFLSRLFSLSSSTTTSTSSSFSSSLPSSSSSQNRNRKRAESDITGQFVIDPSLVLPKGLFRAFDDTAIGLSSSSKELGGGTPYWDESDVGFSSSGFAGERITGLRVKRSRSFDGNIVPLRRPIIATTPLGGGGSVRGRTTGRVEEGKRKKKKNLKLEVENGGIDVDVHLLPVLETSPIMKTRTSIELALLSPSRRKRSWTEFSLIARIHAQDPRPPIQITARTYTPHPPPRTITPPPAATSPIPLDRPPSPTTSIHTTHTTRSNATTSTQKRPGTLKKRKPHRSATLTPYYYPYPEAVPPTVTPHDSATLTPSVPLSHSQYDLLLSSLPPSYPHPNKNSKSKLKQLDKSDLMLAIPRNFQGPLTIHVQAGNLDEHIELSDGLRRECVLVREGRCARGVFVGDFGKAFLASSAPPGGGENDEKGAEEGKCVCGVDGLESGRGVVEDESGGRKSPFEQERRVKRRPVMEFHTHTTDTMPSPLNTTIQQQQQHTRTSSTSHIITSSPNSLQHTRSQSTPSSPTTPFPFPTRPSFLDVDPESLIKPSSSFNTHNRGEGGKGIDGKPIGWKMTKVQNVNGRVRVLSEHQPIMKSPIRPGSAGLGGVVRAGVSPPPPPPPVVSVMPDQIQRDLVRVSSPEPQEDKMAGGVVGTVPTPDPLPDPSLSPSTTPDDPLSATGEIADAEDSSPTSSGHEDVMGFDRDKVGRRARKTSMTPSTATVTPAHPQATTTNTTTGVTTSVGAGRVKCRCGAGAGASGTRRGSASMMEGSSPSERRSGKGRSDEWVGDRIDISIGRGKVRVLYEDELSSAQGDVGDKVVSDLGVRDGRKLGEKRIRWWKFGKGVRS